MTDQAAHTVTDGDRIATASLAVLLALSTRIATAVALGAAVVALLDMLAPASSVGVQVATAALVASIYLNACARRSARNATSPAVRWRAS